MKLLIPLALLSVGVSAFPKMSPEMYRMLAERNAEPEVSAEELEKRQISSKSETNCGPDGPCPVFNAQEQYVSTSGQHAYASPLANQLRGPCPGLNAAANHGYLPRSGVPSITQTITGLGAAYAMSVDLAGFLAAYAVAIDGDVVSGAWSIGGPPPTVITGGLLGKPQGISCSHNKYEGDSSLSRPDAYVNDGDAHSLIPSRFATAASKCKNNGNRCTLDLFRQDVQQKQFDSVATNPYYFAPLFSTTLVSPAAYHFILNFMSNHTAAQPNGYLNNQMFKSFFAVAGTYPNYAWKRGQERIPDNWYRRPSIDPYNAVNVFQDLGIMFAAYPDTFRFGGNTNGVNTYQGVDIATLTGGTFTPQNVLEGDNFACLFFQTQQQATPDLLKGSANPTEAAAALINKYSAPIAAEFECPQLNKYDSTVFNKFPGRNYSAKCPPLNY